MTKTYSSVREAYAEALQSGLLDRALDEVAATNRRPNRRGIGTSTLSQSFTVSLRRPSYNPDTRSSFLSNSTDSSTIDEDCSMAGSIIATELIQLSSDPPPQEIDLNEMTSSRDLERLRVEDPFMYHSIPEVHQRSYKFDEGDAAAIAAAVLGGGDVGEDGDGVDVDMGMGMGLDNMMGFDDDDDDDDEEEEELTDESERGEAQQQQQGSSSRSTSQQQQQQQQQGEEADAATNRPSAPARQRPRQRRTLRSLAASCPAGMLANADIARAQFQAESQRSSTIIKRRRLSVEAHPSLICEDVMERIISERRERGDGMEGGGGGVESMMDEEERFLHALMMSSGEEDYDDEEEEED